MFTKLGTTLMELANKTPMGHLYDPYNGNFGFTETQVLEFFPHIQEWLRNHSDYMLLYHNGVMDDPQDEPCWWLTDSTE